LQQLRDTPNQHLNNLSSQVKDLSHKLEPMLEKVEQAQKNIDLARSTY